MAKLTGGQALAKALEREQVRVVFGLPGAGQYEAIDAIYETPSIRYFTTRHEQATTYMADGYARVGDEIAAALVVPGPGLLNAAAGIATAYAVSSPLLVISGTHHPRPDRDSDEMTWMRPLTKWAARAQHPADVPALVREAFHQMKTGRPRPVFIEIPHAVLAATAEIELSAPEVYAQPVVNYDDLQKAAQLLANAQRPLIWAGGGVHRSGATQALQRVAEYLQAPVVTSPNGKGAISDHHPLALGLAELNYPPLRTWIAQHDLILAIGTRTDFSTYKQQVVQIDIDAAAIPYADHIFGVVGDAQRSLEALYPLLSARPSARTSLAEQVQTFNRARFDPAIQLQPQWDLMHAIRAAMPDDGIFVQDMTQLGYYSRNYYPVYTPRTYLTASAHGTLGSALPLALGAKIAKPDQAVVAICGDGGFLYNAQELATAVQYGLNIIVIVFNDNAYGNVLRAQREQFNGHILGTQLHNPDFAKLAQSYGARGLCVEGAAQLELALREAMTVKAPTVIEVPVGAMERQY